MDCKGNIVRPHRWHWCLWIANGILMAHFLVEIECARGQGVTDKAKYIKQRKVDSQSDGAFATEVEQWLRIEGRGPCKEADSIVRVLSRFTVCSRLTTPSQRRYRISEYVLLKISCRSLLRCCSCQPLPAVLGHHHHEPDCVSRPQRVLSSST